ncbi:mitochondrial ATPase complex subunit Atp10p [[Candida] railenensis]|uniref:Mitochondrial ATPase complex subunit Atp10p n=1 Tax=[Candida] railenensis TaxID=45579 RepID=A0A9P0VZ33_9ASCO|nr:mitochondrial ATPase complex subunit Atp10p [[Candida] railenensis]
MFPSFIRYSSTPNKLPRIAETLKQAAKPALQHSLSVSKPFGLSEPTLLNPLNGNSSYDLGSIKDQLFSSDAKERRQKELDHDIAHSPFYESKSFENVGGKIFTPPISFFKRDKSKYFPNFLGDTLIGKNENFGKLLEGKVNIVRIYSTISGDNVSRTYFQSQTGDKSNYLEGSGYEEFKKLHPNTQIIDLNMPQTAVKRFFVNISKGSLKKMIPQERHDDYFILPYKLFPLQVRQELNCDNVCSGYIYLLDQEGRIRWATSGSANEAEYSLMWKCVSGLERELKALQDKK